jgi:hypothetical protein
MATTSIDFGRYVWAVREGGYRCSYCGHDSGSVLTERATEGDEVPTAAQFAFAPLGNLAANHDLMGVICTRCGNANFFDADRVRKWVEKNPSAAE